MNLTIEKAQNGGYSVSGDCCLLASVNDFEGLIGALEDILEPGEEDQSEGEDTTEPACEENTDSLTGESPARLGEGCTFSVIPEGGEEASPLTAPESSEPPPLKQGDTPPDHTSAPFNTLSPHPSGWGGNYAPPSDETLAGLKTEDEWKAEREAAQEASEAEKEPAE